MVVNMEMLRRKIADNNMSIADFSTEIGINPSTFYRKAERGGKSFTVGQMHRTGEVLNLTDAEMSQIFLFDNSQ